MSYYSIWDARVYLKVRQTDLENDLGNVPKSLNIFWRESQYGNIFTVETMWANTVSPFLSLTVPHLKEAAAHLLFHHKSGIFYEFACTCHAEGRFHWVKKAFLAKLCILLETNGANTDVVSSTNPSLEHRWFQKSRIFLLLARSHKVIYTIFLRSKRRHSLQMPQCICYYNTFKWLGKKSEVIYNCFNFESFTIKYGKKYTSGMRGWRELAMKPMVLGIHPTEGSKEQIFWWLIWNEVCSKKCLIIFTNTFSTLLLLSG